jgi:hypothetical protein
MSPRNTASRGSAKLDEAVKKTQPPPTATQEPAGDSAAVLFDECVAPGCKNRIKAGDFKVDTPEGPCCSVQCSDAVEEAAAQ